MNVIAADVATILSIALPAALLLLLPLIRWAVRGALRDVITAETKPRFDEIARAHARIDHRLTQIEGRGERHRTGDRT